MEIVDRDVERYMSGLLDRHSTDVLEEMEARAEVHGFPIVGRHVGVTLELLARSVGAGRVFELGSGYGYSAFWFARAVGPGGEVHCTDGDPENAAAAKGYLERAGLWDRVRYHVGDAVDQLGATEGAFDIVYDDIDKHGYPAAWKASRDRIRPGGLYVCDNVLWRGWVAGHPHPDDDRPEWTEAIIEHNQLIADDPEFVSSILPIRDGVLVALRLG